MKRRDFITLIGGAAAACSVPARAQQQPAIPVIGFLDYGLPAPKNSPGLTAFRRGLSEAGYVEGRNVTFEFRWAHAEHSRLPELAADLVRRQAAVIVATGSPTAVLAAKAATSTVPIVFAIGVDPVKYGFVDSFNRPSGNVTGINLLSSELMGKRLSLLLELAPQSTTVGYLSGPAGAPVFEDLTGKVLAAAQALGREIVVLKVRPDASFTEAFATIAERQAGALLVGDFTSFADARHRGMIIELAARHQIPTMYPSRMYTSFGGLMSYSPDFIDANRQLGVQYVGRILKGAKPADLPVLQPTKFELVINLKTAKALHLTIPPSVLAIADEVIE
jgi:putative tryptophan/tyrosine transport system substrate-binding protein